MDKKDEGAISFFVSKEIKSLYKGFLFLLEDMVEKEELDENAFPHARKRVLDLGGDAYRNFEEHLENYVNLQNYKAGRAREG